MRDTHGSKSKNSQTHSNSVVFVLQVNIFSIETIESNHFCFLVEISYDV
jgi:hypothetical protein